MSYQKSELGGFFGGGATHQGRFNTCGIHALCGLLEKQVMVEHGINIDAKTTVRVLQSHRLKNEAGFLIADRGTTMQHLVAILNQKMVDDTFVFLIDGSNGAVGGELKCKIDIMTCADEDNHPGENDKIVLAGKCGTELGHFMKITAFDHGKVVCQNSYGIDDVMRVPGPVFDQVRFKYCIVFNDVQIRDKRDAPFKPLKRLTVTRVNQLWDIKELTADHMQIVSIWKGNNLDVLTGEAKFGGHEICTCPPHNRLNQCWKIEKHGDYVALKNSWSGNVLDVLTGEEKFGGHKVCTCPPHYRANQLWKMERHRGHYAFRNAWSGNVLDVLTGEGRFGGHNVCTCPPAH